MLASHVPRYGSVDLIDFDALESRLVCRPQSATSRAWATLEEAERRLDYFDWLVHVVREPARMRRFAGDLITAYLLTFEATLQIVKHESFPTTGFDRWLSQQSSYDIVCRGLRTLRNLEAHIRSAGATHSSQLQEYSRFAGGIDGGCTVPWLLPPISPSEYGELLPAGRKLLASELAQWNQEAEQRSAAHLMRHGVERLIELVIAAS